MRASIWLWLVAGAIAACGPTRDNNNATSDAEDGDATSCPKQCSADGHAIVDCNDNVIQECAGTDACDSSTQTCTNACLAAENNNKSIGCDYYATTMENFNPTYCFAMFVANTWTAPAHINVEYQGMQLGVANFARIPTGSGTTLTYAPYDATAGLAPGEVAVLFLAGNSGAAPNCPAPSAVPNANITGTGIGSSFHVTTDVPVVAYQINPYGGGSVAITAASLLLPTSVWDLDYVAVNVSPQGAAGSPSLNIIAKEDGTLATITPRVAVAGGTGIPGGAAGQPININLNKGQHAQITQTEELTGSIISSNKPIGFMAGQRCMNMPAQTLYCDHGEQMIPPVRALGSRYVGVMYRPRTAGETTTFWRMVGAVDGTQLNYSTNVGGPAALNKGESVIFETGTPFIVTSQDSEHPFMLFTYMTSSNHTPGGDGYGDPDFVVSVPPEQYLQQYVFFADPTYPETNLVVVRSRGKDGNFKDVNLDCAGPLQGWTSISPDFEYARADLVTGNFANVGNCSTGRREITSDAPFGLWVWGWGTPLTSTFTANVSYGYPGGMNVTPINDVIF